MVKANDIPPVAKCFRCGKLFENTRYRDLKYITSSPNLTWGDVSWASGKFRGCFLTCPDCCHDCEECIRIWNSPSNKL